MPQLEIYSMDDNRKTKEQLIQELEDLRRRIAELEKSETEAKRAEEALRESPAKLEKNLNGAIDVLSETIEGRGSYAPGHHQRVAALASAIAQEMGLTDFQVQGIDLAAAVYDIGLMHNPIEFLQNTERLEGNKLTLYQGYPQTGHDTLKKIEFPWPIADIILQHRECFDGSGFPRGIKGDEILIEARILAVAHALEDLTANRSYRNAFPLNEALEEIATHSGSKYDPEVVATCLRLFREKGYRLN
jgi:HD-GYP domain-containing protein (c-di-GMP phosphodiesterase class II)